MQIFFQATAVAALLPGDTCNILVRRVGYKTGERLGQQFVIDNRTGASGQLGHGMVAQAAPDGYTPCRHR